MVLVRIEGFETAFVPQVCLCLVVLGQPDLYRSQVTTKVQLSQKLVEFTLIEYAALRAKARVPQNHQLCIRFDCYLPQFPARVTLPQNKDHMKHAALAGLRAQGLHGGFSLFQVLPVSGTRPGDFAQVETAGIHNVEERKPGLSLEGKIHGAVGRFLALRSTPHCTEDVLDRS
jgi:hypothetical protein